MQDIRGYPTFVINLDRRKDRWDEFSKQGALKEFKYLKYLICFIHVIYAIDKSKYY